MTLKTAALLAFIGMLLLTVLMVADFIKTVMGVLNDVVPAAALLRSLIYLLASVTVSELAVRVRRRSSGRREWLISGRYQPV